MNNLEKNKQIIEICTNLKPSQKIVFSDEGNLNDIDCVVNMTKFLSRGSKPEGLWYSFGASWFNFLTNDYDDPKKWNIWGFKRVTAISHIYKIYLDASKILTIDTLEKLEEFDNQYNCNDQILWDVVSKNWSGVEIRYLPRLYDWYKSWDCSSGCIWNPNAIKKIKLLSSWESSWQKT